MWEKWFKLQYTLGQRPTRQYKLGPGLPDGSNCRTNWVPAYQMVQTAVQTGSKAYQMVQTAVQTVSRPTRWFKLQYKLGPGLPDGSNCSINGVNGLPDGSNCSTNWVKGLPDGSNWVKGLPGSTNWVPAYQAVQTGSRPTRQYKLGQRPTRSLVPLSWNVI